MMLRWNGQISRQVHQGLQPLIIVVPVQPLIQPDTQVIIIGLQPDYWATDSLELTVHGHTYQWHPTTSKNVSSLTTIDSVSEELLYTTETLGKDD